MIRVRNISLGDYSPGRHYDKYNEKTIIIQANSRFYRHISSTAILIPDRNQGGGGRY